jgi:glycosyltransferase involved in cell wall biosynthesis
VVKSKNDNHINELMNEKLPLITVITVVYNGASFIEQTIQSVFKLSYPNINYIIVDGASKDGTADIIKNYESRLFYWISEPDNGIYDAMNKAWAKANDNSYIIFLGAGDYIIRLPDMTRYANENIVYGKVEIGNRYIFNTIVDFRLKLANALHHQALLIKKNIYPQPPFLLQYPVYADFDFNQRLYKAGYKFVKDPDFFSYAAPRGVSSVENRKEMIKIVYKNFGNLYVLIAKMYYMFQDIKRKITGFPPLAM